LRSLPEITDDYNRENTQRPDKAEDANFLPSRLFHTFHCHCEPEEQGRGNPAGWIASSLRSSQ
jgi:hypothetical protein